MQLSENFSLSEFTKSQIASRYGIDNTPDPNSFKSLVSWCHIIGEPVRDYFGSPVIITSGFRSAEVNKKVKGNKNSQHLKGEAADFEVIGHSNLEVAHYIKNDLNFDQLILEFWDGVDPYSGWVHCSIKPEGQIRNEVLQALSYKVNGKPKVRYIRGLPL